MQMLCYRKDDNLGGQQQQQAETAKRQVRIAKKPPRPPVVCGDLVKSGPPRRYSRAPARRVSAVSFIPFPRRHIVIAVPNVLYADK